MQRGILDKYGVELIGAKLPSINKAEDRELFKQAMAEIGLKTPPSGTAESMEDAMRIHQEIGRFPLIIRPAFTLGGSGGGIAYNMEEYEDIVAGGLAASVTNQVGAIYRSESSHCKGAGNWNPSSSRADGKRLSSSAVNFITDANSVCLGLGDAPCNCADSSWAPFQPKHMFLK